MAIGLSSFINNMLEKEIIVNNNKIKYIKKQGVCDTVFVFLHGWGSNHELF